VQLDGPAAPGFNFGMTAPGDISHTPFQRRLGLVSATGGFRMDGWWIWCGSAIRGDDGRYHLFAARWPHELKFLPAYQSYSEIVRASADTPVGPFTFEEVVLGDRGSDYWDGRMTHNPVSVRWHDRYLLFYIGTTFAGPKPSAAELASGPPFYPWYRQIRIGVAVADSVLGPWRRPDQPLLHARPGAWDAHVVTNPSPCVADDGRLFLYYRSYIAERGCRLGLAIYEDLDRDPIWRSAEPLFDDAGTSFEDPFVFQTGGHWEMLAKDLTGKTTGELHAGTHLLSSDGIAWRPAPEPKAYGRRLRFDDGTERLLSNVERPFLLLDGHEPTHLYAAMAEGGASQAAAFDNIRAAWNGVIPLQRLDR
jgi:hypothetical protein